MAEFGRADLLRIYDSAGVTHHRWQSYFAHHVITHDGHPWLFMPFSGSGLTGGTTGDEGGFSLSLPAVPAVIACARSSQAQGWRWEFTSYQFTTTGQEASLPDARRVMGTFTGTIVGASETLTTLRLELGSALAPVGASIPPRTMTTRLIGKGCRL